MTIVYYTNPGQTIQNGSQAALATFSARFGYQATRIVVAPALARVLPRLVAGAVVEGRSSVLPGQIWVSDE